MFFTYLGLAEGKSFDDIQKKIKNDLATAVMGSWTVWIPAHTVNFKFVPTSQRLLYINTIQASKLFCAFLFCSFIVVLLSGVCVCACVCVFVMLGGVPHIYTHVTYIHTCVRFACCPAYTGVDTRYHTPK